MRNKERFDKLSRKYHFDKEAAEDVINWIEKRCSHVKGDLAGKPLILPDYFKYDIIYPVFGLKKYKAGPRLISECYIEIPKKNAKTTILAGLQLYLLVGDGEKNAEIYNMAGDDEQANLLFNTCKQMVDNDDILRPALICLQSEIRYKNSKIKRVTSKAGTKHGQDAHAVIIDELHVQEKDDLYHTVKWAGAQRPNSLFFQITTAGNDKTTICWSRHEYTRQINEGILEDDNVWGVIYAADQISDDPEYYYKESTWKECNPIWDYSEVFRDKFRQAAKEAQNDIKLENAFKQLRLNVWTKSDIKWISDVDWMKGNKPLPNLEGMTCYGGLDLASTRDTASLVLTFMHEGNYYCLPYIFVPERMIDERDRRNQTYYYQWAREGYLIQTPGNVIDYKYIHHVIEDCSRKYNIKTIGYDPYNARQKVLDWIEEFPIEFVEYRQGIQTMGEPTKEFERLLLDGKIFHGGHPVLRWMADNANIKVDDNDNYMVKKGKISKDKVDGIIALIISIGECVRFREQESEIYIGSW